MASAASSQQPRQWRSEKSAHTVLA